MRKLLHRTVAASAIGVIALLAIGPAGAKTCSERINVCKRFCAKTERDSPGCLAACAGYREQCLASGCWESKYVAKECGFTRQ